MEPKVHPIFSDSWTFIELVRFLRQPEEIYIILSCESCAWEDLFFLLISLLFKNMDFKFYNYVCFHECENLCEIFFSNNVDLRGRKSKD